MIIPDWTDSIPVVNGKIATANRPTLKRIINGSGFGGAPNVVLYHRGDGIHGESIQLDSPEVGDWTNHDSVTASARPAEYFDVNGKTWISARPVDNIASSSWELSGLRKVLDQNYTKYNISFRTVVPAGMKISGAANTGEQTSATPYDSNWKLTWVTDKDAPDASGGIGGAVVRWPDECVPTYVSGGLTIGGNTFRPQKPGESNIYLGGYDLSSENLFSYYQGGTESSEGADDCPMETIQFNSSGVTRDSFLGDPFGIVGDGANADTRQWGSFKFMGWAGNISPNDASNVAFLYRECRVAVGDNSRAKLLTHSHPTLAASNSDFYIINHDSWTDTQIEYTPSPHEDLPYRSIITADGTLLENV